MSISSPEFFSGSKPIALVAGGAGFIGSHVCEKLLDKGVKVICLDNWQTGLRENISHLRKEKNFLLIEGDITKKFTRRIPRLNYILHLAGLEAYMNGEDVSIETLEANSIGTKNLLDLALRTGARFLLGSTIEVYRAKLSDRSVDNYFGATRRDESEYSHHEAKRFAEALVSEFVQKKRVDARIARLGSVYGPQMLLSTGSYLSRIIKQVVYKQDIEIPSSGDVFIYPVFVEDAVAGLLKVLMSSGTKNAIVSLAGPQTSLRMVGQAIAQLRPDAKIIYKNDLQEQGVIAEEVLFAGHDVISWEPTTQLMQGLDQTFAWFEQNKQRLSTNMAQVAGVGGKVKENEKKQDILNSFSEKLRKITLIKDTDFVDKKKREEKDIRSNFWSGGKGETPESDKEITTKRSPRILLFGAFVLLSMLFWIFVLPVLGLGLGLFSLGQFKKAILQTKTEESIRWANRSGYLFRTAASGFEQWKSLPGLKNESVSLSKKARLFSEISTLAKDGAGAYEKASEFVASVRGEESFASNSRGQELALDLQDLEQQVAFLDAEIGDSDLVVDFPLLAPKVLSTKQELVKYRKFLTAGSEILKESGNLLGEGQKKTYLILFQNNSELRPTGGFIGSFALVSFEKGRVINLEVQDVYSADGRLKGHVEPPEPIKEHLGEAGWYLRDSNWNPDFPTSAQRAIWFLDKELGQKVDGVIAVDLEFAKNILRETGELALPDYSETVDANNLYEKAQKQAEGNFFPGSRAKKDYLTAISRALIQKVLKEKGLSTTQLAKVLLKSLEEKHISIWTQSSKVNNALKIQGWDGSIRNITCPEGSNGCLTDYLYIVEANLGVNKSNYFLERSSTLDINYGSQGLSHTLTVNYRNNSQVAVGAPAWGSGGDYKNYVRLYIPEGSLLESAVLVRDQVEEELDVDENREKGKSVVGMLANIPTGGTRELTVKWTVPHLQETQGKSELLFLWQKQSGTVSDPVAFRFNLPQGSYKVAANPVPTLTGEGSIGYNKLLSKDLLFDIAWQAK